MPRKRQPKKSDPVPAQRGRPKSHKLSPLTRRQELFVKELVSNDGQITLREAAINAGYPAGSAHTRAYELTNPHISPHVCAAIKSYRDELDQKFGITYQRHLRDMQLIRDAALQNGAYSAAVQAEYRRGQAKGDIYINKSEIRHGSIDSMNKEEVEKALEDLKQQYSPVTINITPEEKSGETRERLLEADSAMDEDFDDEAAVH